MLKISCFSGFGYYIAGGNGNKSLKWFSCTDTVFVCVRDQRVFLLLIDEIPKNVDSTLSAAQGRAH